MIEKKDIDLEKTVLIGVITKLQDETKSDEYLEELEFLTYTAGGEVLKRFTQKMEKPNPKTFIGTGKMEELRQFIEEHKVGTRHWTFEKKYKCSSGITPRFATLF